MGLRWDRVQATRKSFGRDVDDCVYAVVARRAGSWRLLLTEPGCGVPGGTWLPDAWTDASDAMDAADRYVVAYVDVDVAQLEEQRRRAVP